MQDPKPTNEGRFSCGGYLRDLPPPLHGLPIPLRGMLPQAARHPVSGSQKTDARTLYRRRQTGIQAMHQYRQLTYPYRQKLKPYGRQKKAAEGRQTADAIQQTDRHKKTAAADRFLSLQAVFILSLHPIPGRQGSHTREGKETDSRQKPDRSQMLPESFSILEGIKTRCGIASVLRCRYARRGYVLGCLYRYI